MTPVSKCQTSLDRSIKILLLSGNIPQHPDKACATFDKTAGIRSRSCRALYIPTHHTSFDILLRRTTLHGDDDLMLSIIVSLLCESARTG